MHLRYAFSQIMVSQCYVITLLHFQVQTTVATSSTPYYWTGKVPAAEGLVTYYAAKSHHRRLPSHTIFWDFLCTQNMPIVEEASKDENPSRHQAIDNSHAFKTAE